MIRLRHVGAMGVLAALIVVVVFAIESRTRDDPAEAALEDVDARVVHFELQERSASAQSGFVTMAAITDGRTAIGIELGGPTGIAQPVHLHEHDCAASEDGVLYRLPRLEGDPGALMAEVTVVLPRPIGYFLGREWSIDVHRSLSDATVVACAEIPELGRAVPFAEPWE